MADIEKRHLTSILSGFAPLAASALLLALVSGNEAPVQAYSTLANGEEISWTCQTPHPLLASLTQDLVFGGHALDSRGNVYSVASYEDGWMKSKGIYFSEAERILNLCQAALNME